MTFILMKSTRVWCQLRKESRSLPSSSPPRRSAPSDRISKQSDRCLGLATVVSGEGLHHDFCRRGGIGDVWPSADRVAAFGDGFEMETTRSSSRKAERVLSLMMSWCGFGASSAMMSCSPGREVSRRTGERSLERCFDGRRIDRSSIMKSGIGTQLENP